MYACMYVRVSCICMWWKRLCVFYAVPFLVNADITTKFDKFSTISRCIDNDNLHAKNVWQMPPCPSRHSLDSFPQLCSFVALIAKLTFGPDSLSISFSFSFSIHVRHKYANARRDKNATVICDIIILPCTSILVINSF